MIVSFLTYTPLFFWARGIITVNPSHWWKFQVHKEPVLAIDPGGMKRRSISMIAFVIYPSHKLLQDLTSFVQSYPIVFVVVTLPLSVVRLKSGFGTRLSSATFVVECIYSLSGAVNVALILLTRSPLLLPRGSASRNRRGSGVAPSNSVLQIKHEFLEISRPDAVLGIGNRTKPVSPEPLAEGGEVGWDLPASWKHGSTESI
jgi:hypothetical protein